MSSATRTSRAGRPAGTWSSFIWYPGGKTRGIKVLKNFIPPDATHLCSPFLGGGSFELFCNKEYGMTVSASDINEPLMNFWQVLKHDKNALIDCVRANFYPPMSRELFYHIRDFILPQQRNDPVMRAAGYFALNLSSFSALCTAYSGKYYRPMHVDRLEQADLDGFDFNVCDYQDAIARQPQHALLYLDPPYALPEGKNNLYGKSHREFDHQRLFDVLRNEPRRFILSYNDCPLVRQLYGGGNFNIYPVAWSYTMGCTKDHKPGGELVITNFV
jgi:DNA adenine methylase